MEGAFGVGELRELPKDRYFNGRTPLETSEESMNAERRALVWREAVKLSGLKEGETALTDLH